MTKMLHLIEYTKKFFKERHTNKKRKRMKDLSKYINLVEGETIVQEIEGDAYNEDSHPLARLIGSIIRVISIILGFRMKTHIVVTDKRVIQIDFEKTLWVINKGVSVISMTPRSIANVGYSNIRKWFIFKTRYFIVGTSGGNILIKFKGNDKMLFDAVTNVNNVLEKIVAK